MANPYYGVGGVPATQARGASATIRSEFVAVQTGFDSVQTAIAAVAGAGTTGTQLVLTATSGATPVKTIRSTTAGNLEFVNSAGTGVLVSITDAGQVTFSGSLIGNLSGNVSGSAASITGINPVANGGTGVATLSGIPYGNGTSALTAATANQIVSTIGPVAVANATTASNALALNGQPASYYQTAGGTFTGAVNGTTGTFSGAVAGTTGMFTGALTGASASVTGDIQSASQNGGQLAGMRNRIINGDMRIDQRNSGAAVTLLGGAYIVDRWYFNSNVSSKLTLQQVIDAPAGFKYSTKISVASQYAPAAGDLFSYQQRIEGQNIIDFQLGTAGAATLTLGNYIKGSVTGTYSCHLYNSTANRSYVGTIAVTNAWAPAKITLVGDITGTWLTDNSIGLTLGIDLGSGTSFNAAAGAWNAGIFLRTAGSVTFVNQAAGSTLNITGVQLELGSVATPFEQRPIGLELALCQRYYYQLLPGQYAVTGLTDSFSFAINLPVQMRVQPSVAHSLTDSQYTITPATGTQWGLLSTGVAYAGKTGTVSTPVAAYQQQVTIQGYGATFSRQTTVVQLSSGSFVNCNAEL